MDKVKLKEQIDLGKSKYLIAEHFSCSKSNVGYWLTKYNLKTKFKSGDTKREHLCVRCSETRETMFYKKQKMVCITCRNIENSIKYRRYKLESALLFGGKCIKCGYAKCLGALEFHHRDPGEKDIDFKKIIRRSALKRIEELQKCDLLCSNCHREIHFNDFTDKIVDIPKA